MSVYREPGKVSKPDIYQEINELAVALLNEERELWAQITEVSRKLPKVPFKDCGLSWQPNRYDDHWVLHGTGSELKELRAAVKALPTFLEKFRNYLKSKVG